MKPDLSLLAARWSSLLVAREKVGEFFGGIITPKTMANMDCNGEGEAHLAQVQIPAGSAGRGGAAGAGAGGDTECGVGVAFNSGHNRFVVLVIAL